MLYFNKVESLFIVRDFLFLEMVRCELMRVSICVVIGKEMLF